MKSNRRNFFLFNLETLTTVFVFSCGCFSQIIVAIKALGKVIKGMSSSHHNICIDMKLKHIEY